MKPKYVKFDAAFEKKFKKYTSRLTEMERLQLRKKLTIFKQNVFDARLKTHKLKGRLTEYYSFRLHYSDRIVFKILDDGGVYFMEIGGHDVCY